MNPKLIEDPIGVTNRLHEVFEATKEDFLKAVDMGVAGKKDCTLNHPLSYPGTRCWGDATGSLRETFSQKSGWKRDDSENIPSIFHKERKIKIAICNTTIGTGLDQGPQPKRLKKDGVRRATFPNKAKQTEFENLLMSIGGAIKLKEVGGTFWYLCIYCEFDNGCNDFVVRAELICPILNKNGTFKGWVERIALIDDRGDKSGVTGKKINPDGGSDFEINVTRKRATT